MSAFLWFALPWKTLSFDKLNRDWEYVIAVDVCHSPNQVTMSYCLPHVQQTYIAQQHSNTAEGSAVAAASSVASRFEYFVQHIMFRQACLSRLLCSLDTPNRNPRAEGCKI